MPDQFPRSGVPGGGRHPDADHLATARWSYSAARWRRESRGMHQRDDAPVPLPVFARRQSISGIDAIHSSFRIPERRSGTAS